MQIKAKNVDEYIVKLPQDKREPMLRLRDVLRDNLPFELEEVLQYDMITYVVPKTLFPKGYHCNPEDPLPFVSLGAQKNHVAIYHMGIYMMPEVMGWFAEEYPKHMRTKLDMGKSCIRFKNMETIPYELIAELCKKMTVKEYIHAYEQQTIKKD